MCSSIVKHVRINMSQSTFKKNTLFNSFHKCNYTKVEIQQIAAGNFLSEGGEGVGGGRKREIRLGLNLEQLHVISNLEVEREI
jgi:hypothetical protein